MIAADYYCQRVVRQDCGDLGCLGTQCSKQRGAKLSRGRPVSVVVELRSWCAPCSLLLVLLIWVEDVWVQYYQSPSRVPQFDKPLNACCHAMLPRGRRVVCGGWAMVGFRTGTSVAFGRWSDGRKGWSCGFRGLGGGRGEEGCRGHVVSGQALLFGRGIHKKSCTPSKDEK